MCNIHNVKKIVRFEKRLSTTIFVLAILMIIQDKTYLMCCPFKLTDVTYWVCCPFKWAEGGISCPQNPPQPWTFSS